MAHQRTSLLCAAAALVACAIFVGRKRERTPYRVPAGVVVVPATHDEIRLDGEWEEASWDRTASRHVFVTNGIETRPFSELRLLHDAKHLYVTLYAADENVLSSDRFELTIGTLHMAIDPAGHILPEVRGVEVGADLDGTLDHEEDADEEWVIELAIPLAAIGGSDGDRVPLRAERCDTPRAGGTICGAWSGSIVLDGK